MHPFLKYARSQCKQLLGLLLLLAAASNLFMYFDFADSDRVEDSKYCGFFIGARASSASPPDLAGALAAYQRSGYSVVLCSENKTCDSAQCIRGTIGTGNGSVDWSTITVLSCGSLVWYSLDALLYASDSTASPPVAQGRRHNLLYLTGAPESITVELEDKAALLLYDVIAVPSEAAALALSEALVLVSRTGDLTPSVRVLTTAAAITTAVTRGRKASIFRDHIRRLWRSGFRHESLSLPGKSNSTAVIVEAGAEMAFEHCVRTALRFLGPGWALQVHHSAANAMFVRTALLDVQGVSFHQLSAPLHSIAHYNALLKSAAFWDAVDSDRVLVLQSDSLVLSSEVRAFADWAFVGAPWDVGSNQVVARLRSEGAVRGEVGNGGFSFRNGRAMQRISAEHGAASAASENEDVFFVRHLERGGYALPTKELAYSFCLEVPLEELKHVTSHSALHAAWYYLGRARMRRVFSELERQLLLETKRNMWW